MQFQRILIHLMFLITLTPSWSEEYLLRIKDENLLKALKSYNLLIKKKISKDIYLLKIKDENALKKLSFSNIKLEKNYSLYKQEIVPNDPCLNKKWEYDITELYKAWQVSTGSQDIYVAILDTGVDYNHPDLKDNLWKNPDEICYNNIDDDGNGYVDDCYGVNVLCYPNGIYNPTAPGCNAPDALDDDVHGTHIAGIIGAVANNGLLIAGVNWNVKIIPCKFLDASGNGDIAGEIECLNYIKQLKQEKGLNIVAVNASYGNFYNPSSSIQRDEILSLKNLGILYITAAGNNNVNIDSRNFYPCNYDLENEICVGASDKQDNLASFSNYGYTKVKILAPGEGIYSLKNNNYSGECTSLLSLSGTSMATPFITGAVALLKAVEPNLSLSEVRKEIILSGDNNINLSGKTYSCNRINYNSLLNGDSRQAPKICLSSLVLNFESVYVGNSTDRKITVRNTGYEDIVVQNIEVNNNNFFIRKDTCSGIRLKSLEECEITITFKPQNQEYYEGTLQIDYNDNRSAKVRLIGRGLAATNNSSTNSSKTSSGGCNGASYGYVFGLLAIVKLLKIKFKKFFS